MGVNFSPGAELALDAVWAEPVAEAVIETDRHGAIVRAMGPVRALGLPLPGRLAGSSLFDLVHPSSSRSLRSEHAALIGGRRRATLLEFPALDGADALRWFEIEMRAMVSGDAGVTGVSSTLRAIADRRAFEEKLFAATMTDHLTGLTNRRAFVAMLAHLVEHDAGGCIAVFDIDHFRAINLKFGQSAGDEVLVCFADMLRCLMRSEDIISRISGESLGVLLPRVGLGQARALCRRVIATLSEVCGAAAGLKDGFTASAGLARIGASVDDTMRAADLALFLAKAKGRNRLEVATQ